MSDAVPTTGLPPSPLSDNPRSLDEGIAALCRRMAQMRLAIARGEVVAMDELPAEVEALMRGLQQVPKARRATFEPQLLACLEEADALVGKLEGTVDRLRRSLADSSRGKRASTAYGRGRSER